MDGMKYRRPRILDELPLDRHAVIEASAGTGKTFILENLVVEILLKTDATIDQILAVTFTEKATGDLRARIRAALESVISGASVKDAREGEIEALDEAGRRQLEAALFAFDRAPIHTIHSFCQRTLADFAFAAGMRFKIELTDRESAFHEAFRAELRERIAKDREAKQLLNQWLADPERDAAALEKLLCAAHEVRYLGSAKPGRAAPLEARVVEAFLPRVAERMDAMKHARGVLDYDDMLKWLARAIDGPHGEALVAELRGRYRFGLIDEFQDTDELQWKIFHRIFVAGGAKGILHVIGDPKQAIYAFRGADVFAYLAARAELERLGVKPVPLVENFRSTEKLIGAINAILGQNAAPPFFSGDPRIRYDHPVTCGRKQFKAVDAAGKEVRPVRLMKLATGGRLSAGHAREAIGRHIARTLRLLLNEPANFLLTADKKDEPRPIEAKDVYILTRTNNESAEIGEYLRAAGVPFAFYKEEGLFQTREAGDIADALSGVLEPEVRSRRFRAWTTPFFAVPFADLPRFAGLPASRPIAEQLYEWKLLAGQERFADLFDAMLHRCGLADRELFLADSERALTNYQHIFEILLEQAVARRLSLTELIELLDGYIAKRALPAGENSNVQRLESERGAVRIMTMHKAKGLEAGVVFLFGGTHRGPGKNEVAVYHDAETDRRRFAIGKEEKAAVKNRLDDEDSEESRRLMYVAITRARAKLYLPHFPDGSTKQALSGPYKHLNDRLKAIAAPLEARKSESELFEIEEVRMPGAPAEKAAVNPRAALAKWNPPLELFDDAGEDGIERELGAARKRHAALEIRSYTSLAAERGDSRAGSDPEDFKIDLGAATEAAADLPGGREVGIFIHEAIEQLDLKSIAAAGGRDGWMARGEVRDLFASLMRRHGVRDPRWLERGRELVWNALTAPIALGGTVVKAGLCRCRGVREMEFAYPIPQPHHRLLGQSGGGAWRVERGYFKGFVDFVFEHQGLTYFADWKSDLLPSYEPAAIAEHVRRNYAPQAEIYTVGVVRLLGIRSGRGYRERFGGVVYVFLRGVDPAGGGTRGVHFIRPSWDEVVRWEAALMTRAPAAAGQP